MKSKKFSITQFDLTRRVRIISVAVFLIASLIVTSVAALMPMTLSEAQKTREEFERIEELINVPLIFGNNFMHCLIMFTPFVGPIWGFYVLYNTGRAISAIALTETPKINPIFVLAFLFLFPVAWMEYVAYATAMSQSVWFTWQIFQHQFKKESFKTCVLITFCALLLLLAAVIEIAIKLWLS
ncbi:MAG: stage II sporulation protein M [Thermoproteota archaeon]|nr:stage II sporulation protein M [Thermoproteota archaeon]